MSVVKRNAAATRTAPETRRTMAPPLRTRASWSAARWPSSARAKSGSVAPAAYASVIATSSSEIRRSALSALTAARIGPAQGVQTSARPAPSTVPDQNPSPPASPPPARAASGWKARPSHSPIAGTSRATPATARSAIARLRSRSCGSPSACSTREASSVKMTNATARPTAMPRGRRRPPVVDAAATTGNTGSTHGERKVARPATAATAISVTSTCDVYATGRRLVRRGRRGGPDHDNSARNQAAGCGFRAARARAARTVFESVSMS